MNKKQKTSALLLCISCFALDAARSNRSRTGRRMVALDRGARNSRRGMRSSAGKARATVARRPVGQELLAADSADYGQDLQLPELQGSEIQTDVKRESVLPELQLVGELELAPNASVLPVEKEPVQKQEASCGLLTPDQLRNLSHTERDVYIKRIKELYKEFSQEQQKEGSQLPVVQAGKQAVQLSVFDQRIGELKALQMHTTTVMGIIDQAHIAGKVMAITAFIKQNAKKMDQEIGAIQKLLAPFEEKQKQFDPTVFSDEQRKIVGSMVAQIDQLFVDMLGKMYAYIKIKQVSPDPAATQTFMRAFAATNEQYRFFLEIFSWYIPNVQAKLTQYQFSNAVNELAPILSYLDLGGIAGQGHLPEGYAQAQEQKFDAQLRAEMERNRLVLEQSVVTFTNDVCQDLAALFKGPIAQASNKKAVIDKKMQQFEGLRLTVSSKIVVTKRQYQDWAKQFNVQKFSPEQETMITEFEALMRQRIKDLWSDTILSVKSLSDVIVQLRNNQVEQVYKSMTNPNWKKLSRTQLGTFKTTFQQVLDQVKVSLDKIKGAQYQLAGCMKDIYDDLVVKYNDFVRAYNELDEHIVMVDNQAKDKLSLTPWGIWNGRLTGYYKPNPKPEYE